MFIVGACLSDERRSERHSAAQAIASRDGFPYLEPAPKGLTDPIEKSTSVTAA
jgi:hypothetical protein